MKERDIQNSILEWLAYQKDVLAFTVNNTGIFDESKGIYRKKNRFFMYGVPDILCCVDINGLGIFVGLEVKTVVGKQNAHQRMFEDRLKRVKGYYFVVRSIEDARKVFLIVEQDVAKNR